MLSFGTGSHGTLGIRDIKLAGGIAIAQQPTNAEFDSMPSSIINEGLADFILRPADMGETLMHYVRQPNINPDRTAVDDARSKRNDEGPMEQQSTASVLAEEDQIAAILNADNDYRVNLKAELEIRHLHSKIDLLLTHQWQRLLEIQQVQTDLLEEMGNKHSRRGAETA